MLDHATPVFNTPLSFPLPVGAGPPELFVDDPGVGDVVTRAVDDDDDDVVVAGSATEITVGRTDSLSSVNVIGPVSVGSKTEAGMTNTQVARLSAPQLQLWVATRPPEPETATTMSEGPATSVPARRV